MARSLRKMFGGAVNSVCPPGFFCMDTGFVVFVGLILLAIGIAAYTYNKDQVKKNISEQQLLKIIVEQPSVNQAPVVNQQPIVSKYPPPEREYNTAPDMRGFKGAVPINFPTRGLPEEFQQMGVLTAPGGSSMSASPNRTLLPLLGRRSANSRDRYNYYTRTDGLNPMQVPVSFKNRGCDDDTGCDEIMSGDTVGCPLLGQTFTATVYKYNAPRYIASVF